MRKIYVEPEMLIHSASKVDDSNSEFVRLRNKLNDDVDFLSSSWSGKDNRSFVEQVKANNPILDNISIVLSQYSEFLRSTAQAYKQVQEELANEALKCRR